MELVSLRRDLRAARRASAMVHDPVSSDTLRDYIHELENRLYRSHQRFRPGNDDERA